MKYIFSIVLLLSSLIFHAQDCENLPYTFDNYDSALNIVKSSNFLIKDSIETSKSSWIDSLTFYSCNKKGFLVIGTKNNKYIHQNVPISIWKELKQAPSLGAFYNKNIKGNFKLNLK